MRFGFRDRGLFGCGGNLLLLAVFSACSQAPPPPLPTHELEFAHVQEWASADSGQNVIWGRFQVEEYTEYQVEIGYDATWAGASAAFKQHALIRRTDSRSVIQAMEFFEATTSCQEDPTAKRGDECDPRPIHMKGTARGDGSLLPGSYVILARSFGADHAEYHLRLRTNQSVQGGAPVQGRAWLWILEHNASASNATFDEELTLELSTPFFATMSGVGPRAGPREYAARDEAGRHYTIKPAEGCCGSTDDRGVLIVENSFAGPPGNWTFSARGGVKEGPAYAVVGIVEGPDFVSDNGTLERFYWKSGYGPGNP